MNKPLLELRGVSKSFGTHKVVTNIDLTVKSGEIICLIGPSGSGKSTLLRMINQLEKLDEGTIIFEGKDVTRLKKINVLRSEIGMVFQGFNLFGNKSVLDNCLLPLKVVKKMNEDDALSIVKANLTSVDMLNFASARVTTLSGGQKQRVAIARALCMDPKLMLFDEPTSALDPELVGEVLKVMKDLAHRGLTMLIVTHEINFAAEIADRIVMLDEGKIIETGKPLDILKHPKTDRAREFLSRLLS